MAHTLVDYPIHDGLSATTSSYKQRRRADHQEEKERRRNFCPRRYAGVGDLGGRGAIPFEIGEGLQDQCGFWVHPKWNAIPAHIPDASTPCLPIGSTEIYLLGHFPDLQLPKPEDVEKGYDDRALDRPDNAAGKYPGRPVAPDSSPPRANCGI